MNQKYIIRKLRPPSNLDKIKPRHRRRKEFYDGYVRAALLRCWEIFDYPCPQRLRQLGELGCSDGVAGKLRAISARTIDEKLRHQKEVEGLRRKYHRKKHPLLYQEIPVKLSGEQDRTQLGNIQIDLVEHCGQSARGEYINTLSTTDINSGWWEGEAVMGRSPEVEQKVRQELRKIYLDLNPAQLKREIDDKSNKLFKYYQQKNKSQKLTIKKKLKPNMVTSLIAETQQLSVT
ncbi:hypothetical protein MYX76_00655 [Desulfobacterota bacterium AH_259_B03_O07]|nr:hypothetical protein [Desulfobacterota bacterium AH_259_B03_O07]